MSISLLSNLTIAEPAMGDGHHLLSYCTQRSSNNVDEANHLDTVMMKVISSLAPIRSDGYKLWKLLFQLSFSDDSLPSMAVLRAILALASLYRHGHSKESLELKAAALGSLTASLNDLTTGTREIYQHVAVGMLICAFEVFCFSSYRRGSANRIRYFCHQKAPFNGRYIFPALRACCTKFATEDILS
jgi:hypothetical protein